MKEVKGTNPLRNNSQLKPADKNSDYHDRTNPLRNNSQLKLSK